MAGRIADESVKEVRDRASIVEVIGAQVALRSAGGGRLKGLCPFHDEKSPSLNVSPASNLWHCFGCGAGGDVIKFVRELDGLSFSEAIERLARQSGVELRYEGAGPGVRREVGRRQRLVDASRAAAEFYGEQLRSAEAAPAREFLMSRGFDGRAAELFGVGYAPGGWDTLVRALRAAGFTVEELIEAGLARQSSRGTPVDRFQRRLLWPIRDPAGDVVGFGARRLFDDDPITAKYLNTPETALFKKSHLLYGADLARRSMAQRYQAVIVEGYTDVMACHAAGVTTAVATCGTAFGEDHVKLLRRLLHDQDEHRAEVVFAFDGDKAGQAAARKTLQYDHRFVAQTYVAVDPDGRDPCELRQAGGDEAVRDLVARRIPLVEFAVRAELAGYDLDTPEGRVAGLRATAPLIAALKDWALRDEYARRLSGWLGLDSPERVLEHVREISGEPARRPQQRPTPRRSRVQGVSDRVVADEREALKVGLQRPVLAGPAFDALEEGHFLVPEHQAIRAAIAAAGGASAATDAGAFAGAVSEALPEGPVRGLVIELAVEPLLFDGDDDSYYTASVLDRMQELHTTRLIADKRSRLQRMNPTTDESYWKLAGELVALEAYKRQLRDRGT